MEHLTSEYYLIEKIKGNLNIVFYCTDETKWGRKGSSVGSDGYLRSDHINTREEFIQFKLDNPELDYTLLIVKDETFEEWKNRLQPPIGSQ